VTGLTLFLFDRYLRVWFTPAAAAAGSFALAAIIPFTYFRVVQESDPLNLMTFVLAFWAIAVGRDLLLVPLVVIGTFNRETTALIPALYAITRTGRRPFREVSCRSLALAASWIVAYGALLAVYGRREYYCDVVMLPHNLESWIPTFHVLLLFGAMWILAILGARSNAPIVLTRSLWLLPFFLRPPLHSGHGQRSSPLPPLRPRYHPPNPLGAIPRHQTRAPSPPFETKQTPTPFKVIPTAKYMHFCSILHTRPPYPTTRFALPFVVTAYSNNYCLRLKIAAGAQIFSSKGAAIHSRNSYNLPILFTNEGK